MFRGLFPECRGVPDDLDFIPTFHVLGPLLQVSSAQGFFSKLDCLGRGTREAPVLSCLYLLRMASSAPILPQALLVASATALGYAPELWPFGEITGTALIVSARAEEKPRYVSACLYLRFVCLAHNTRVFVYVARTRLPGRATRYFTPLPTRSTDC